MNDKERKIIKQLNKIGVDTRYISIYMDTIYINNLKFSKFSRKKEEEFHTYCPDINVVRSKLLQKICIKVSRTIKNQIKPRDTIYIEDDRTPENILLYILLEAYRRKYGITIIRTKTTDTKTASTKCINDFATEYIDLMTTASKIHNDFDEDMIYPLMHIDYQWIKEWIDSTSIDYIEKRTKQKQTSHQIIEFLETKIPNVQESIIKSVEYLDEKHI